MPKVSKGAINQNPWVMFTRDNWSWMIPCIYIYVTYIGMADSWYRFRAFGINVFEFAEINDFLLAAFREPESFLTVLVIVLLAVLVVQYHIHLVPRIVARIYRVRFGKWLDYALFSGPLGRQITKYVSVLYIFLAPIFAPYIYDELIRGNPVCRVVTDSTRHISVTFRTNIVEQSEEKMSDLLLVGATGKFLFFYGTHNSKFVISPISNVQLLSQREPTAIDCLRVLNRDQTDLTL